MIMLFLMLMVDDLERGQIAGELVGHVLAEVETPGRQIPEEAGDGGDVERAQNKERAADKAADQFGDSSWLGWGMHDFIW
jgi:hypothetical protein